MSHYQKAYSRLNSHSEGQFAFKVPFFMLAASYVSILRILYHSFVHSSVETCLACFQGLVIVSKVTVDISRQALKI